MFNAFLSRLLPILFCQQSLNHFFRLFVTFGSRVAQLDYTVLVDHKMARPRIAEIVAPDLIFVIDDNGVLDPFRYYSFFDLGNVLLIVDARSMNADDNQAVFSVLVVKLLNMRHRLSTERTIPGPEINEHNLATQLLKLQWRRVDPGVSGFQLRSFLPNKRVVRMLRPCNTS